MAVRIIEKLKVKMESDNLKSKIVCNALPILLIVLAVFYRVLPHPANFAPVAAVALFGGVYLKKSQVLWLPLLVMMASDLILGLHSTILFTWGSFLLIALLGVWVGRHKNAQNVVMGTLAGSLLFYFVTNFGVWAITPLYAKTFKGLLTCYVMAIPFFRNTLLSDVLFVAVLFGTYEIARQMAAKRVSITAG